MRRFIFAWIVTLAGCHLALGLDELEPGRADDDDEGASSNGGAGGGQTVGSTSSTGGGASVSTSTGMGGGATSSSSSGNPSVFRGPDPGNFLLAGYFGGSPGPKSYVVVTKSGPAEVALSIQFLHKQTGALVGAAVQRTGVPDVLADTTDVALGTLMIPAEANPVSDFPIVAEDVVLRFESNSPPCGTFLGMVTSPIMQSIDGSTFSMTSVAGPNNLPANPPLACP
jgi:hypothetical protein